MEAVEDALLTRDTILQLLQENLIKAQKRMKKQADKSRTDKTFHEGYWVYIKLQPYRQLSCENLRVKNSLEGIMDHFRFPKR